MHNLVPRLAFDAAVVVRYHVPTVATIATTTTTLQLLSCFKAWICRSEQGSRRRPQRGAPVVTEQRARSVRDKVHEWRASSRGWLRVTVGEKQIGPCGAEKHWLAPPRTPISILGSRCVPSDRRVPASASSYGCSGPLSPGNTTIPSHLYGSRVPGDLKGCNYTLSFDAVHSMGRVDWGAGVLPPIVH